MNFVRLFWVFAFMGFAPAAQAEIEIPPLRGPIMDDAGLLDSGQVAELDRMIRSYLPIVQMQVWTIRSLEGEAIESVSIRATDRWRLGTEKGDNGILILVAKEDRRVRIEVGQGLEGAIPDVTARRVIDQLMVPDFRAENYYQGLRSAIEFLYAQAKGENPKLEPPRPASRNISFYLPLFFIVFILLINIFGGILRSIGGGRPRGRGGFGGPFSSSGGWGRGSNTGFGGGFGGGGWSGGGGGFSGGGSSGRW